MLNRGGNRRNIDSFQSDYVSHHVGKGWTHLNRAYCERLMNLSPTLQLIISTVHNGSSSNLVHTKQ
jgi:hypothetical protein